MAQAGHKKPKGQVSFGQIISVGYQPPADPGASNSRVCDCAVLDSFVARAAGSVG